MAKDKYHDLVRELLEDEGWTVTDDPLKYEIAMGGIEIDLGAEMLIGAEKEDIKIAVEIKSFIGHSRLHDLYKALGQFIFYLPFLKREDPNRILYLTIPEAAYKFFYKEPIIAKKITETNDIRYIIYNVKLRKIIQWQS